MKRKLIALLLLLSLLLTGCNVSVSVDESGVHISDMDTDSNSIQDVNDKLEIHYIDIGQGDSTLIKCGEHAMLIDAGENDKGTEVQAYLESQNVKKLDYLICTHPDSDHEGGIDVIIYKFDCDKIIMSDYKKTTKTHRDVIAAMESKNYSVTEPVVGHRYSFGESEFTIIAPNGTYKSANDSSVGIILKHGNNKFLFTGDAEEEAESDIVDNGIDIDCDIYQVGHHGSRSSSSEKLLNAASPAYAVISCGEGNDYGHPHAATMNEFRMRGIKVFRTDLQGTIVATSDGSTITFNMSPDESWLTGDAVKSR